MYEANFALRTRPFPAHPAEGQFLPSSRLDDALERTLAGALVGTGIAAVTGPAGVGKTAFCLELARRTIKPWKPVFLSSARFATSGEIWQAVLCALEREFTGLTPCESRLHLIDAARKRAVGGGGLLLIVDEAHLLDGGLLEELRVLTSELDGGRPIIRLVLSGQLELEDRLALPELAALSQRLGSHVLLEPLTREESRQFVRQQVEAAGGRLEEVFTDDALELICAAGDGNCRCLNLLCDHTLLLAYVAEERPASAATVQSALEDLKGLPQQWYQPPEFVDSSEADSDTAELFPATQASSGRAVSDDVDDPAFADEEFVNTDNQWSGSEVAVIEFGTAATTTEPLAHDVWDGESGDGVPDREAGGGSARADCIAFDNGATETATPESDIVETCVEDLYARLDRLLEAGQAPPAAAPFRPTALPPANRSPQSPESDWSDDPADDPEAGAGNPLESGILAQIDELHAAIEDRLADSPLEWQSADAEVFWSTAEGGWDVIEPENGVSEHSTFESEDSAAAPEALPASPAAIAPEAALRVLQEFAPPDAEHTEASPAGRYAGLFTRLKQRRREAAEAMWAGIALTDR